MSLGGILSCTVQEGLAGSFVPEVVFGAQGRADADAVAVTFELVLEYWGPRTGSTEGGTILS